MIDPRDITKYDRTQAELEEYWLFCIVAAGKTATTQARLLEGFLVDNRPHDGATPFETIQALVDKNDLLEAVKRSRLGQYNRISKAFHMSLVLNLKTDTCSDFEGICGVGPKTARFFLLHTRKDQKIAVLDTHVLRYLRDKGLTEQKVTPPAGKKYAELEALVLKEAKASGMNQADFDLHIWRTYSGNPL